MIRKKCLGEQSQLIDAWYHLCHLYSVCCVLYSMIFLLVVAFYPTLRSIFRSNSASLRDHFCFISSPFFVLHLRHIFHFYPSFSLCPYHCACFHSSVYFRPVCRSERATVPFQSGIVARHFPISFSIDTFDSPSPNDPPGFFSFFFFFFFFWEIDRSNSTTEKLRNSQLWTKIFFIY